MAANRSNERPLLIDRDGPVETLTINDPPRNRLSLDFMDALEAEVTRIAEDSRVRAVVVRGAGDENFSVGMDLKQLPEGIARMGGIEAVLDQRLRVLEAIENLGKPVIAAGSSCRWPATFVWRRPRVPRSDFRNSNSGRFLPGAAALGSRAASDAPTRST